MSYKIKLDLSTKKLDIYIRKLAEIVHISLLSVVRPTCSAFQRVSQCTGQQLFGVHNFTVGLYHQLPVLIGLWQSIMRIGFCTRVGKKQVVLILLVQTRASCPGAVPRLQCVGLYRPTYPVTFAHSHYISIYIY